MGMAEHGLTLPASLVHPVQTSPWVRAQEVVQGGCGCAREQLCAPRSSGCEPGGGRDARVNVFLEREGLCFVVGYSLSAPLKGAFSMQMHFASRFLMFYFS